MSKITTADCKKFLVAQVKANPNIIHDIFRDTTTAIAEALDVKKWKRESKFNPDPDKGSDYADDKYELWYPRMGPGRGSKRYTELVSVRRFWLDPDQFENAVMFNVLEDINGQLWLGEYVGD